MRYTHALAYLNSLVNYERISVYRYTRSFKRARMQAFLNTIENPHKNLNVIHVAGSKGKGSVCLFIASILKEAGYRVGLYTSPHLHDCRERIRILDKKNPSIQDGVDFDGMITKKKFAALLGWLKPQLEVFALKSAYGSLSFFEVYTALALLYFKEKKVDYAVLETGLGGRLDATNVCSSLMSVITPISYEHTYLLGKTLSRIAYEKASIIKKKNKKSLRGRRIALSAQQPLAAARVIASSAKKNNALRIQENRDFHVLVHRNHSFDYQGREVRMRNLRIGFRADYQYSNAGLAIASCQALGLYGILIDERAIRRGLRGCRWPARFEVVSRAPCVILDGAQNEASIQALHASLKHHGAYRNIWVIFGIAKDKELRATTRAVSVISKNIIVTQADNPRAMKSQELVKFFKGLKPCVTHSVADAITKTLLQASRADCIVVTGSLFVCAEAREIILTRNAQ